MRRYWACFRFGDIRGVIMDMKYHITWMVPYDSVGICGNVVEEVVNGSVGIESGF